MRSIATEAGVDPSLLVHFFGTKKRLFDEVIDLPFDPEALNRSITNTPVEHRGEEFARHVVNLLHDPHYREALTGLIRAATSDPEVAELFRQRHRQDVVLPLAQDLDIDRAELRVALAATQTIGLVMGRHVMKIDALTALTDDEMVTLIGPTLQRYLTAPL